MTSNIKKTVFIYITAVFLLLADRFLKFLSIHYNISNKDLIGEWLKIKFIANPNIAFSIPFSGVVLNITIAIILIILLLYYIYFLKHKFFTNASLLSLIFLGAASNFADRIKYGFVIDYLNLKYFTVFNIADAMIVVGVFFIIILNLNSNNQKI